MNTTVTSVNSVKTNKETARFSLGVVIRSSLVFIVLCGLVYPLISTGVAQLLMPAQANGSLIRDGGGAVIGSALIGQSFNNLKYFHGRLSSIAYKADASGSNNYAPSNPDLAKRVQASIDDWNQNNPDVPVSRVPIDLLTNSGSGLDPHISPTAAAVQVPRISKLTGVPVGELDQLIAEHTEGRSLGVFGELRVNVLLLNLALKKRLN